MEPIQTFFMDPLPDGLGRVTRYEGDKNVHVGDCTKEEFGEKFEGNIWSPLYRRMDTGEILTFTEAPIGAMYYADGRPGPDGKCLVVKVPSKYGGTSWYVDGRANNCDMPNDDVHRCWVRHGDPRECRVTVDKDGVTCHAGAGSIQTDGWHGHLKDGKLVD